MIHARRISVALAIAGEVWLVIAVPAVLVSLLEFLYVAGFILRRASPIDLVEDAVFVLSLPVLAMLCGWKLVEQRYLPRSELPVATLLSPPTSR